MTLPEAFKGFSSAVIQRGDNEFYTRKISKHIEARNVERVISYICHYFENDSMIDGQQEPSANTARSTSFIMDGIEFLKSYGYRVKVGQWENIGTQIIIFRNNEYYHSNYNY